MEVTSQFDWFLTVIQPSGEPAFSCVALSGSKGQFGFWQFGLTNKRPIYGTGTVFSLFLVNVIKIKFKLR